MTRPLQIRDDGSLHHYRTEIPNTIVKGSRSKTLSVQAKWFYVYLKSIAGDTQECWQSTSTLAAGSGLSRMSVSRVRQELARHGLIVLVPGSRKNRDAMTIRIVDIWTDNMQEFSSQCTTEIHQSTTQIHQQVVDVPNISESSVPHRYTGVPQGYSGVPQEIHKKIPIRRSQEEEENPLLSHFENGTVSRGGKYSQGFEDFWHAWEPSPRKDKKSLCYTLWKRRKLEPRAQEICQKVGQWWQTRKWRDGYEPGVHPWLYQYQYDDEVPGPDVARRRSEHEGHRIATYPSGKYCHTCQREVGARELVN